MHASYVALLALAASSAAPVFAAPLPRVNARSEGGSALSTGHKSSDCSKGTPNDNHATKSRRDEQLATRDSMSDFMSAIANINAREPGDEQETQARNSSGDASDVAPDTLAARASSEDEFLAALLSSRDLNTGPAIQARSWLLEGLDLAANLLGDFLRRDVSPGDMIAARDDTAANEYLAALLNSRGLNEEQAMEARNWLTRREELSSIEEILRNSPPSDDVDLSTRSSLDELEKLLNTRDSFEDFINAYVSKPATRESTPQQETEARSVPDETPETVTRDDTATNEFIKALLQSRESSKEITPDHALALASLASRALDELD